MRTPPLDLFREEPEESPTDFSIAALRPRLRRFLPPNLLEELTAPGQETQQLRSTLADGLNRLQRVHNLLGLYIPGVLREIIQQNPTPGAIHGQMLSGTILFADVAGFTALTERLSARGQKGVEEMVEEIINPYLKSLLEVLGRFGGDLLKFAGDAILAYFPAAEEEHLAPTWAVRAALSMQEVMNRQFKDMPVSWGSCTLTMKVGIESGSFLASGVGTPSRMEYVVMGFPLRGALRVESCAGSGQVVIGPETHRLLRESPRRQPLGPDVYLITEQGKADDFEMRARSRRPRRASIVSNEPSALFRRIQEILQELEAIAPYLSPELASKVVSYASERSIPSDLRPATAVIFGNLLGPDEMLADRERFDPAAVTAILQEAFVSVHREVEKRGGVISRIDPYSSGSKLLVLFGAPQAHENDPHRAVDAALAMRRVVSEIDSRILPRSADGGPTIQLRAGITYGPTMAGEAGDFRGRREYTVMGDEVNLAARLMGKAPPGEIYVSQSVRQQIAGHFTYKSLPPIQVKGKANPIPVYAVQGRAELIGREQELKALKEGLEQTLKGRGLLLSFGGPVGSGTRRLSVEAINMGMNCGMRICRGRCLSFSSKVPYAPWVEALGQGFEFTPADSEEGRWEKLEATLNELGMANEIGPLAQLLGFSLERRRSALARQKRAEVQEAGPSVNLFGLAGALTGQPDRVEGPGISQQGIFARLQAVTPDLSGKISASKVRQRLVLRSHERIFNAVNRLLRGWAGQQPLLLSLEDFHLADDTSLDLLMRVAGGVMAAPILIIVTAQPAGQPFRWEKLPGSRSFPLRPLSPEDSLRMAACFMGRDDVPAEMAALIREKAQGNPLYISQLVSSVEADGIGDVAALSGRAVGGALDELILSRIDRLGAASREVLTAASVFDGPFNYRQISKICPSVPESLLAQTLEELCSSKWLVRHGELEVEYAIADAKVGEVAYSTIPFKTRGDLHEKIADRLAASAQAERLAFHYSRSNRPEKATPHLLRAARTACQRGAYPEAEKLLESCLQIIAPAPGEKEKARRLVTGQNRAEEQAEVLEELGDVLALAGRYEEAEDSYRSSQAVESARSKAPSQAKRGLLAPLLNRAAEGAGLLTASWAELGGWQLPLAVCAAQVWLAGKAGRESDEELWRSHGQSLPQPEELPEEIKEAVLMLREVLSSDEAHPGSYAALWPYLSAICFWSG